MYKVFVGHSQLEFAIEDYEDMAEFSRICLKNGYRVTVVPMEEGEDEV